MPVPAVLSWMRLPVASKRAWVLPKEVELSMSRTTGSAAEASRQVVKVYQLTW